MSAPENPHEPANRSTEALPPVAPDVTEQEFADEIDNVVPTRGFESVPVVGIGGSAGSIGALQSFFSKAPTHSGMAFVVILHLSPEHESTLAEVLQRTTAMPVQQVRKAEKIRPDHVYVIPPGKQLASHDGMLHLHELPTEHGRRVAIDLFFRSLADTHGPHAVAVVLSGFDGDGAIGIKRIKERGGLTVAQDPDEAAHDEMPRASIATGMVDWVLRAGEMPTRIKSYRRRGERLQLPPEAGPPPTLEAPQTTAADETALREVLSFLRTRTGRDFSYYKRATILRRIARRMQVNDQNDVASYLAFLRTHNGEPAALLQDLLISVTNFFRDRDCFTALEKVVPQLFAGKGPSDTVRVWVPACATGEEAYSVAMLLSDHARTLEAPPAIQIFATDLDEGAIHVGRDGFYSGTIAADVAEDRLRRYFVSENGGYRVRREIRETVLFALHDLLKDSPFSRLDLVTCRNLLIYLNREAQTRALDVFHFALRPKGILFLGASETIEDCTHHFSTVDKRARIFARRPSQRSTLPVPMGASTLIRSREVRERVEGGPVFQKAAPNPGGFPNIAARPPDPQASGAGSWSELHLRLIDHLGPPSLLVNAEHDIVHLSARAGAFLHFPAGEPSRNLLRAVHPMLRVELRSALYRAAHDGVPAKTAGVPMERDGQLVAVDIQVASAADIAPDYFLVTLEVASVLPAGESASALKPPDPAAHQLEKELEATKSQLRELTEQHEASIEELKANNEELQAMNEELRSATEELETSREELQSINEELTTVNGELKSKVDELGLSNSDLQNLIGATSIATVFLDRSLRVTRYTPSAVPLFNLIATDIGRPLSDVTHHLDFPELMADVQGVLRDLTPVEREVRASEGRCFIARIVVYRTYQDTIGGVVLTFVDITARNRAEAALRESVERFHALVHQAAAGVFETDGSGRITLANQHFCSLVGRSESELLKLDVEAITHPEDAAHTHELLQRTAAGGPPFQVEKRYLRPDGTVLGVSESVYGVRDAAGNMQSMLHLVLDLTELTHSRETTHARSEQLRTVVDNVREYAIFTTDLDLRVTAWNRGAERILGYTEREILGQKSELIFIPEDLARNQHLVERDQALRAGQASDERWHVRKDGGRFWASGYLMAVHDTTGRTTGFVKILRDQTQAREFQQALENSQAQLKQALAETEKARADAEAAAQAKDQFLAVLSHELRTPLNPVLIIASEAVADESVPEPVRERFETVRKNIELEARLIDDLLDLTRITRGKMAMDRQVVDAHDVLTEALENLRPQAAEKQIAPVLHLNATRAHVIGDPARLQQIFWNVLSNAFKFSSDAGEITVTTTNAPDPGWVRFRITDSGIGMSASELARVFDAFRQGDHATFKGSAHFGGLGLGLAITEQLVVLHEGRIFAASDGVGKGCTFIIELPAADPGVDRGGDGRLPRPASVHTRSALAILLVEDHASTREALRQLLVRRGHTVTTTGSVAEAVQARDTRAFDLLISDLGLPDGDGCAVLTHMRANQPHIRAIALSGYGMEGDIKRSSQAGFLAHLVKPITAAKLDAAIEKVCPPPIG